MSAISNQWGACKSVNLDFFEEMTKMIGKWIEKGEKIGQDQEGLKSVCWDHRTPVLCPEACEIVWSLSAINAVCH